MQVFYECSKRRRWLKRVLKPFLGSRAWVALDGFAIALDPCDERGPSFHIGYDGERGFANYEVPQKNEILRWLPRENGVYIDVGANVGPIAFYLKRELPSLRVLAFEAHPKQAAHFAATIQKNNFHGIAIEAAAVGRTSGKISLYLDESDFGGHSVFAESCINNKKEARALEVPLLALDDCTTLQALPRVDVIKMDVQGAENDVFWGALRTIERFAPVILVEGENMRISKNKDLITPLEKASVKYKVKHLEYGGYRPLRELATLAEEEQARTGRVFSDYVLVPESRLS
jgi:FkbM family methyltransferase